MKKHLIKRHGQEEVYDEKKVYASVYAAALNCHYNEKESEIIALKMMKSVNKWIKNKKEVSSSEIRKFIIEQTEDKHVSLMYKHHLDIC